MSIIIYQNLTVVPTKGGISRMSSVYYDILTKAGYEVWYVSSSRGDRMPLERQLYIEGNNLDEKRESLHYLIKEHQVELMIYQDGIAPRNSYILLWAKEMGLKNVCVIHSTLNGMYGVDGHPLLSAIKPKALRWGVNKCVNYYFMHKYGRFYREEFENSDKVILLSDKFQKEITFFTGWHDFSKFQTISNPLTMAGRAVCQLEKVKSVLHVGLLSSSKRQDLLFKIWKLVESKRPDWQLKVVGEGGLRKKLESQAKKLGLVKIKFLGFQSPEPFYEEAPIFCLTSGFESFGLVLVESMAYGCVPIAFNSFETACDIIDDGVNGKLIPPFDIQKYADELIKLMDDEALRAKMSAKAIEKSKTFDIDKIGHKWITLVHELLNDK